MYIYTCVFVFCVGRQHLSCFAWVANTCPLLFLCFQVGRQHLLGCYWFILIHAYICYFGWVANLWFFESGSPTSPRFFLGDGWVAKGCPFLSVRFGRRHLSSFSRFCVRVCRRHLSVFVVFVMWVATICRFFLCGGGSPTFVRFLFIDLFTYLLM